MVVDDKDEGQGEEAMEKYNGEEEDGFVLRSLSIRLPVHVDLCTISAGRGRAHLQTQRGRLVLHLCFLVCVLATNNVQ